MTFFCNSIKNNYLVLLLKFLYFLIININRRVCKGAPIRQYSECMQENRENDGNRNIKKKNVCSSGLYVSIKNW